MVKLRRIQLCFLVLLLAHVPATRSESPVKDEGGFFTADTLMRLGEINADLKRLFKKELLVETYKEIPAARKAKFRPDKSDAFFDEWAKERARDLKLNGVFVLLNKNPPGTYFLVDNETLKKALPLADSLKLREQMLGRFVKGQYNEGLLEGATFLRSALRRNLGGKDDSQLRKQLAAAQVARYAPAPAYSEGPTWRDGEVFFCSNGLLRVSRDRKLTRYLDLAPAGTCLRGDGHLLIGDNKHHALLDLAPDGKLGVVVEQIQGSKLNSLNDVTIDRAGNIYWTDPTGSSREKPVGNIFRVRPDGRADKVATGLAFPNGLDVDPDGKYLYVIESQTAKILRYELPADDQPLAAPVVFYALGGSGGDGCTFDADGNLWVADFHRPETKQGRITVLSPDARVLAHLDIPARLVSNLAFGGPKHDEIFVTTGEPPGVFHARVGVPGFRGHPGTKIKIVRFLDLKPLDEPVDAK